LRPFINATLLTFPPSSLSNQWY